MHDPAIETLWAKVQNHRASGSQVHVCVQMLEVYNERLNEINLVWVNALGAERYPCKSNADVS